MINVTHGVEPYGARFRSDLETWSERLNDAGYTNGYFGKWHVERTDALEDFGFDDHLVRRSEAFREGFRTHRESLDLFPDPDRSTAGVSNPVVVRDEGYNDYMLSGRVGEPAEGMADHFIYDRGLEFIREAADSDGPWSAVISTYAPHDPYLPPAEFRDQYHREDVRRPGSFDDDFEDRPEIYSRQREIWDDFTWDDYAEAIASYYGYCSFLDWEAGRVIETLRDLGELDNTIILYVSDHGDYLGAHGMFLKGAQAFEEAYRVPCLVRTPSDYPDGVVRDEIVQLQDLAPTLVDLATGEQFPPKSRVSPENPHARGGENVTDLAGEPSFTATSLVPFLHDERPENHRNEAFAEFHGQDFGWTQRVYWNDDLKYVFNTFDRDELYDLREDPYELRNLAADPNYEDYKKALSERMWEIAHETADYQISELHYGMHRFAPVGPNGRSDT